MSATAALRAGFDYVRRNPFALVTVARHAARLRLVVPLDVVRWGLGKIRSDKLSELAVSARPPGLGLELVANVMGNRLRVGGTLHIDEITVGPGTLRAEVRLRDLSLTQEGGAGGPLQALLASGAIDLKKPGNLVAFLPERPALLVEADGDRFVLDLMQVRALARNQRLQRLLGLISPVVSIRDVDSDGDDLLIGLRITPTGLPVALASLRQ
jgi:hypothetical protein